jgi:hypothetical protein
MQLTDNPVQWNIERAREHLLSAQKLALEDKEKHASVLRDLTTAIEALESAIREGRTS